MIRTIYSGAAVAFALLCQISYSQGPTDARPGVLLLEDFRVVEGTVEPIRDARNLEGPILHYRVTAGGDAQVIATRQVLMTGTTRKEAYEFLKKKKKADSHEDRVWLALWCQKNALIAEGRLEAKTAQAMVPDDTFVRNLVTELENTKVALTDETIRIVRPKAPATVAPTKVLIPGEMITAQQALSPLSERTFNKVGTILQNQCLKCHETGKMKTGFALERVPEGVMTGAGWKANMNMAAKYARSKDPAVSPLVTYAVTPHGGQLEASLGSSHPAAKNLAAWAETFPLPVAPTAPVTVTKAPPVVAPAQVPVAPVAVTPTPPTPTNIVIAPATPAPIPTTPVDPNAPKKVKIDLGPGNTDPFDPNEFNKLPGGGKQ